MGHYKDMDGESYAVVVPDKAPVQAISATEIEPLIKRMQTMVPDSANMTMAELTVIAQESILYRTVPGRDMHYFMNKGRLSRVPDYKYLLNFATFKEQLLSGNESATLDEHYRPLTEEERVEHRIPEGQVGAVCTITTSRERRQFAEEVKQWLEMGFKPDAAIAMVKELRGGLGTSAIGVVNPKTVKGGVNAPEGWSPLQKAEKLALKNAINRKYGIPTADEMQAMAYRLANRAMPEHWDNVDITQPIDIQARMADLESIAAKKADEELSPEEHEARLNHNVTILRGEEEGVIGEVEKEEESPPTEFDLFIEKSQTILGYSKADTLHILKGCGFTGYTAAKEGDMWTCLETEHAKTAVVTETI